MSSSEEPASRAGRHEDEYGLVLHPGRAGTAATPEVGHRLCVLCHGDRPADLGRVLCWIATLASTSSCSGSRRGRSGQGNRSGWPPTRRWGFSCWVRLLRWSPPAAGGVAQGLALAAAAIATAALVGYLYGVHSLSGPLGFTDISPVAVLETLILSFGVLLAGPDRGLMTALTNDTAGGPMARRRCRVRLPIIAGVLIQAGRRAGLFDTQLQSRRMPWLGSYPLVGDAWWTPHRSTGSTRSGTGPRSAVRASARWNRRVAERTAEVSESNAALQSEVAERKPAEAGAPPSRRTSSTWPTTPSFIHDRDRYHPILRTGALEQMYSWTKVEKYWVRHLSRSLADSVPRVAGGA